jgi:hypothetical protein
VWLRVADPDWADPLSASYAGRVGGRWNPSSSFRTLYLSADLETAQLQLDKVLRDSPVRVEDLDGDAYILVAATLPRNQTCADALGNPGLEALGLPPTYPVDARGHDVTHATCQSIGQAVHDRWLRGVACRSACTADGRGTELAWFPATSRSQAHAVWDAPLVLGAWRDASTWGDVGLSDQVTLR